MNADLLRQAADEIRRRSERARAGKWRVRFSSLTPEASYVTADWANDSRRVATCAGSIPEGNLANAEHIASWDPAVALEIADWLDSLHYAMTDPDAPDGGVSTLREERHALAIARAYLGEPA